MYITNVLYTFNVIVVYYNCRLHLKGVHIEQSGVLGLSIQGEAEQVADFRSAPFCTPQVFADMLGVTADVVRGWVETSTVPTIKIGRRRIINLHKVRQDIDHGKSIFCAGDYGDE